MNEHKQQLWEAVKVLDDAAEYLANDAGERDIFWSEELNEATKILQRLADKLRTRAVNYNKGR